MFIEYYALSTLFRGFMSDFIQLLLILGVIALTIFLLWFFIFKVKHLRTPDVYMVDGGVKVGKSLVCVKLAVVQYYKNLIQYYFRLPIIKLINKIRHKHNQKYNYFEDHKFKKMFTLEKPMLYSNMPLYKVRFNWLTLDIIERKVRIPHKSVCLIDEATLLADSLSGMANRKDSNKRFDYVNENLTMFLKLYGHATHGGSCFYNSQNVVDLHFSFRRCTSIYLFLVKTRKFPFFLLIQCREVVHDEANDIHNEYTQDVDNVDKPLFISKRWYRYYDRYYLDVLTKNLPLFVDYKAKVYGSRDKQELRKILTLNNYKSINEFNKKHDSEVTE